MEIHCLLWHEASAQQAEPVGYCTVDACAELMVRSWAVKLSSASSISSLPSWFPYRWMEDPLQLSLCMTNVLYSWQTHSKTLFIVFLLCLLPSLPSWAHHISLIYGFYFTEVTSSEYQSRQLKWATDMKTHQCIKYVKYSLKYLMKFFSICMFLKADFICSRLWWEEEPFAA